MLRKDSTQFLYACFWLGETCNGVHTCVRVLIKEGCKVEDEVGLSVVVINVGNNIHNSLRRNSTFVDVRPQESIK